MSYLKKEDIKNNYDLKTDVVDMTSEWGGVIKIREMSLKDTLELYDQAQKSPDKNFVSFWLIKCCINEDHTPMFTEDDEDWLKDKKPQHILKVYDAIRAITQSDIETDELAKNS